MVSRSLLRWSVAAIALLGARSVAADPINFTGNVANDFTGFNTTVPDGSTPQFNANGNDLNVYIPHDQPLANGMPSQGVAQPQWMNDSGLVSGWNIKDIRVTWDSTTDTAYVGVNTYGIAGNVDGNGTPGNPDPRLLAAGGSDDAHFGGDKGLALGFAPANGTNNPAAPSFVAGIPGMKSQAGTGLDGFTVASYAPIPNSVGPTYDLTSSFGHQVGTGALAFDPNAQQPGFEFSINNFSKLLGSDPTKGFWLSAQAGSVASSFITGKDWVQALIVPPAPPEPQKIPEPTTWMAWLLLAGGAAYRFRRRGNA